MAFEYIFQYVIDYCIANNICEFELYIGSTNLISGSMLDKIKITFYYSTTYC